MLEVQHIKKTYNVGGNETKALNDVSVSFREKEFVAILGMSGSGKTTFLNIVGGLDRYDSGNLIIKGKETQSFTEQDWDAYRNNSIGFIFQTYNLIMHLSIVDNVEIGMTLSGVSASEKRKRALEVLDKVGLTEHLHKKPNQLSGGQMQRVAIARALANDPEILLCDEPTGALDTTTSKQIMDLIREVASDKLVIMVTHNPDIAEKYADRIIRFQDGKITSDSNPCSESREKDSFSLKKTSMSFFTALKLSFNNIRTKKGRTFLTALASSIGIIGIAVILSLSTGFQITIDNFQSDTLSEFPIIITQMAANVDAESISAMREIMGATEAYAESDEVFLYDPEANTIAHTNVFTEEYLEYLKAIDPEVCSSIGYSRLVAMNLLRDIDGMIMPVALNSMFSAMSDSGMGAGSAMTSMSSMGLSSYPKELKEGAESYLVKNYDVLAGDYPEGITDLVLVIDRRNRIDFNVLKNLGFETEDVEAIKFEDIVGTEFKVIHNDAYYVETPFGTYLPGRDYEGMYSDSRNITLRISGIVREKEDANLGLLSTGIAYSDELSQMIIDGAIDSNIVAAQKASDFNIMTLDPLDESTKDSFLAYLGGNATPFIIMVYPTNFDGKDSVIAYLDEYNDAQETEYKVLYTDLAGTMSDLTGGIMNGITIVLIAFASISLIVSLVMIAIITYTSVLERTKEIGVLRSLGARKKDITRVFDAETFIIGVFSGLLGVSIAWLATFPINKVIYSITDLPNVAQLPLVSALALVCISTILTVLGGHLPALMAAKRDAAEALRSE